jgi:hypothetical protein
MKIKRGRCGTEAPHQDQSVMAACVVGNFAPHRM